VSFYAARRCLQLIPLLWAIATVTFFLMHTIPGGPFDRDKPLSPATLAALERTYHLDEPLHEQYLHFLADLVRGDLGTSFRQDRPVRDVIEDGLAPTAQLGALAFVLAGTFGVVLGVAGSVHRSRVVDVASVILATSGGAVPSFVVAVFLVQLFALRLEWFDVVGWDAGNYRQLVLPVVALSLLPGAFVARITRAAMLDVLNEDYIRTARAKGASELRVVARHAARNAMLPVLTVLGPILAALVTGSFVIEQYFAIPGIGRAYVEAVAARDYGVIMGTTLLYAGVVAVLNLVIDISYGAVDPRLRA
jgi:oligopeptide transport system permease protein